MTQTLGILKRRLMIMALVAIAAFTAGPVGAQSTERAASGSSSSVGSGARIESTKNTVQNFISAQEGVLSGVETTVNTTNTQVVTRLGQLRDTLVSGSGGGTATTCDPALGAHGCPHCACGGSNQKLLWSGSAWQCYTTASACPSGKTFNATTCQCDVGCPVGQSADAQGSCCISNQMVNGQCQKELACAATQLDGCNLPVQNIMPNRNTLVAGQCAQGFVPVGNAPQCNATCRADSTNAAYTSPNVGCVPAACPAGTEDVNGQCVAVCPSGQTRNNQGVCIPDPCPSGTEDVNGQCLPLCGVNQVRDAQGLCICAAGYELTNGQCVTTCGTNQVRNPQGQCICAAGYELINGQCVAVCPSGQTRNPQGVCEAVYVPGKRVGYSSNGEDPYGQCRTTDPTAGGDITSWTYLNPPRSGYCENGSCTGGVNGTPAPGPYPAGVECWRKADGSMGESESGYTCISAGTTTWSDWGWTCEKL